MSVFIADKSSGLHLEHCMGYSFPHSLVYGRLRAEAMALRNLRDLLLPLIVCDIAALVTFALRAISAAVISRSIICIFIFFVTFIVYMFNSLNISLID